MWVRRLPTLSLLILVLAALMCAPIIHAVTESDWRSARSFLYAVLVSLFCAGISAQLLNPMDANLPARREIFRLLLSWSFLPVLAAIPLTMVTPTIGVGGAYFEMVAAMTTTGGTVYGPLVEVPRAVHLWRGLVGWYGGLLTLIAAYVVLAPRRLGGFEVTLSMRRELMTSRPVDLSLRPAALPSRLSRALRVILPIYVGLTLLAGLLFSALDTPGLVSAVHAMSLVSTSGISPLREGIAALGNPWIEVLALGVMVLAASRLLYARASQTGHIVGWRDDPELRLMVILVLLVTATLFLRHWLGVLTIDGELGEADGFAAFWGALFTSVSYITTTGFQSFAWESARDWSGHDNPGLVLLALCAVGGGAATTAGGIKLIRAYAMIRHGMRELERIAQPHGIVGAGGRLRGLRREGAFIAWAFMMLFMVTLLAIVLALTLTGMSFHHALAAAVAALSNTGPALAMVSDTGDGFEVLGPWARSVLVVAMILGRVETLAVIALLNPDSWGRFSIRTKNSGKSSAESPQSQP